MCWLAMLYSPAFKALAPDKALCRQPVCSRYTGLSRGEDREGAGSRNGPKRVLARSPFRARHSPSGPAFPGQQFGALAAQLLHNDAEKPAPGAGNFPAACTDKKIF